MIKQAYIQGFIRKCAEYGINPGYLIKKAQTNLTPVKVEMPSRRTYTVASGDTVSGIASANNRSVADLVSYNPGLNADKISVGQKIFLDPDESKLQDWNAEGFHKVESGDTYDKLSKMYDTPVDTLKKLNPGVDPLKLQVGSLIRR